MHDTIIFGYELASSATGMYIIRKDNYKHCYYTYYPNQFSPFFPVLEEHR